MVVAMKIVDSALESRHCQNNVFKTNFIVLAKKEAINLQKQLEAILLMFPGE